MPSNSDVRVSHSCKVCVIRYRRTPQSTFYPPSVPIVIPSLRLAHNVQRGIFEDAPRKHIPHTNGAECQTDKTLLGAAILDGPSKVQLCASGLETGKAYTAEARTRWLLHGFPKGSPSAAKLHPAQAHTHPPTRPGRYRSVQVTARRERSAGGS